MSNKSMHVIRPKRLKELQHIPKKIVPGANGMQPGYIPPDHMSRSILDPGLEESEPESKYGPTTYGQEDFSGQEDYSSNSEASQQSSELREYVIEQVEGAVRIINKSIDGYMRPQN